MATLPSLADLEAFGVRMGQDFLDDQEPPAPTDPDGLRAQAALDDASALIRLTAGEDWVDEDGNLEAVPPAIETICLSVAQRGYTNPQGAVQATVGDASVTWRTGEGGAIYLTNAELRAIRKVTGALGVSSFQTVTEFVPPVGRIDTRDPLYAPVEGGGDPIPLGPVPWEQ